ncbi:transglycosylase SLT domain-containing protein [Streptococcus dysgalactiae subsp. equisimilis]|uniref:transglycosylase SLT domain-containing protein n=1 Tax=Streptococcus dysgalactiae TaxID=1334 RepID=UPI000825CEE9|nr:transglycosylase SLT domain-containing protein [Streptococcus dysgalactiae]MCY7196798.1 transglycosylase SLT domain-containing protein [Streptococcus dysgalactiae]MCY7201077.1 transglycosylase SLT domain-containing protein [Streptococcus dysgalactiae]MCY7205788.1 transglycosylase SLT domain-containing protein [Streptococcus dysgalactiae]MCY7215333.1 transglycosylase SLT domain-containing protein [Streptococcus dysgalactiae]OCX05200.1 transglycosylase [Streptococcus dysgalactiae subsp. equis
MFKKENLKQRYFSFGVIAVAIAMLAVIFAFSSKNVDTDSYAKKSEPKVIKKVKKAKKTSQEAVKEEPKKESAEATSEPAPAAEQAAPAAEATPVVQQETTQVVQYTAAPVAYSSGGVVLSNGNTAGVVGSQAAAQMAAATGVPQSTWEHIIARESNGNPSAANASGASGLFQTMPGWGSTVTVQDQVNSALNAYRAQGLSAWGY